MHNNVNKHKQVLYEFDRCQRDMILKKNKSCHNHLQCNKIHTKKKNHKTVVDKQLESYPEKYAGTSTQRHGDPWQLALVLGVVVRNPIYPK